jgi:hypothetical protein
MGFASELGRHILEGATNTRIEMDIPCQTCPVFEGFSPNDHPGFLQQTTKVLCVNWAVTDHGTAIYTQNSILAFHGQHMEMDMTHHDTAKSCKCQAKECSK